MEIRQTNVVSRVRFKLEILFFNDCFQVGYVLTPRLPVLCLAPYPSVKGLRGTKVKN